MINTRDDKTIDRAAPQPERANEHHDDVQLGCKWECRTRWLIEKFGQKVFRRDFERVYKCCRLDGGRLVAAEAEV